ncbi:MAG: hypothetical protein IPL27_00245 [Lewinellaceae bacterium]|nr:hypothetical protein [Lewinellaceae bacterium]
MPSDTSQKPLQLAVIFSAARDTFLIDDLHSYWTVQISATVTLQEVTVRDEVSGAYISVLQPIKTEIINRAELRKAACCDLAGCFETQSTVQPTTTNILTNAKELRILGLSGVYNRGCWWMACQPFRDLPTPTALERFPAVCWKISGW